jgi:hypothetical protein
LDFRQGQEILDDSIKIQSLDWQPRYYLQIVSAPCQPPADLSE